MAAAIRSPQIEPPYQQSLFKPSRSCPLQPESVLNHVQDRCPRKIRNVRVHPSGPTLDACPDPEPPSNATQLPVPNQCSCCTIARATGETEYLVADPRYEKFRVSGSVRNCAVLVGISTQLSDHRSVQGVSMSLSEAEVDWREFLCSLKQRGMHGVKLIVSDAYEGLKAARQANFAGVPWQRCQLHWTQNAMHHTPKVEVRKQSADDICNATGTHHPQEELARFVDRYHETAPKLAA